MRFLLILLLLIPAACKSKPPRAVDARYDEDLARAPIVVSSAIKNKVLVQTHSAKRLNDGRMRVQVTLTPRVKSDIALSLYTAFYDDAGGVIAETNPEPLVLQPASTRTYVATSAELGVAYGVSKLPYAALVDGAGVLRARGLVNTREHLESLLEAMDLGVGSIQEYALQEAQTQLES